MSVLADIRTKYPTETHRKVVKHKKLVPKCTPPSDQDFVLLYNFVQDRDAADILRR